MAKIVKIKNDSGEQKTWLGQVFEDQEIIEISPNSHASWASDATVTADINSGDIIVNDGFTDLDSANGLRHLFDFTRLYQIVGIGSVLSEPMGFSQDSTRGNKILSSESFTLVYSENKIYDQDWMSIGNAVDADTGFIMPFPGTVVRATLHCEDARDRIFDFNLYINATDQGSILQVSGIAEQTAAALDLNINFAAGDKLRLRGFGDQWLEDTVIVIWIKWRKA